MSSLMFLVCICVITALIYLCFALAALADSRRNRHYNEYLNQRRLAHRKPERKRPLPETVERLKKKHAHALKELSGQ